MNNTKGEQEISSRQPFDAIMSSACAAVAAYTIAYSYNQIHEHAPEWPVAVSGISVISISFLALSIRSAYIFLYGQSQNQGEGEK